MPKEQTYHHCEISKKLPDKELIQYCWLPSEFAEEGMIIKLKEDDGTWNDGWRVDLVGTQESAEYAERAQRAWKKHRKNTDVAKGTFKKND